MNVIGTAGMMVGGVLGGGAIEEYFKVWKFQPYTDAAKTFKVAMTLSRSYIYSYFEILTPKSSV